MKRKRYSVEQNVAAFKEHELGTPVGDIARKQAEQENEMRLPIIIDEPAVDARRKG